MFYNESFAAFCNRIATGDKLLEVKDHILPEEYAKKACALAEKLRADKSTFNQYAEVAIQRSLENLDDVARILESKTVDGEIPDSVIAYFAKAIYSLDDGREVGYNDLPKELQNIIKVVSVYFMLLI